MRPMILQPGVKLTAQQKLVQVNRNIGNPNIANQQGTSRELYDGLPIAVTTTSVSQLTFFDNVQARLFPETNINQNKLQVGESFTVQRISFMKYVNTAGVITAPASILATVPFFLADFAIYFDTTQVVKPIPLSSTSPLYNKSGYNAVLETYEFDNDIVLPTDIQFTVVVRVPVYTGVAATFIRCTLGGFGTLLSPKTQF